MTLRGSVEWNGDVVYSDADLSDMRAESESKHDRRMERRIAELERQVAQLMALVVISPTELALASRHLPYSVAIIAQSVAAADERR